VSTVARPKMMMIETRAIAVQGRPGSENGHPWVGSLLWEYDCSQEGRDRRTEPFRGRVAEYAAAFAFSVAGNLTRAEPLTNDLKRRFPEDFAQPIPPRSSGTEWQPVPMMFS